MNLEKSFSGVKKIIDLFIVTSIPGTYRIVLFNALSPQTECRSSSKGIDGQPSFLSFQKPMLSNEGLLHIQNTGSINGTIAWMTNPGSGDSRMIGYNNEGTQLFYITTLTTNFTYRALLEILKTTSIKVGAVKLSSPDAAQLKKDWKIIRNMPNGIVLEENLSLSNILQPTQVQSGIVVFDLNRTIDKYTSIEIDITPNQAGFKISMEYEILN